LTEFFEYFRCFIKKSSPRPAFYDMMEFACVLDLHSNTIGREKNIFLAAACVPAIAHTGVIPQVCFFLDKPG